MICFKCKTSIDLSEKKIGFRDACETCGTDLHVCKNCKYYFPGKPNDCLVPNTEYVSDREKFNFCEDFAPQNLSKSPLSLKKEDIAKKLFKDNDNDDDFPSSFDSLFKK
jgi:hypothetical protein